MDEKFYSNIINKLNKIEKENSILYSYINNNFVKYEKRHDINYLCLNIKIKKNREKDVFKIFNSLKIKYKIVSNNKYYKILELVENKNYIILEYVIDSHIIIPQFFLKSFGYKTSDGIMIDYLDTNNMKIRTKKTKEYGTKYGYYSKIIEDKLDSQYETKIGNIKNKLIELKKGKKIEIDSNEEKIILDFFDITTYRNPKMLEEINKNSFTSILFGDYDQNYILEIIMNNNFPHVYKDLKINFIINKTKRNLITNYSMISNIFIDDGNEVIIMPLNPKICIALTSEEYLNQKYGFGNNIYCMLIEEEKIVERMNERIFINAKYNKEDVIGDKDELKILIDKYDEKINDELLVEKNN